MNFLKVFPEWAHPGLLLPIKVPLILVAPAFAIFLLFLLPNFLELLLNLPLPLQQVPSVGLRLIPTVFGMLLETAKRKHLRAYLAQQLVLLIAAALRLACLDLVNVRCIKWTLHELLCSSS